MGDEMGLGKTIQLVCFLGGLHFSGKHRPALIVAPVTTLQHWLRELHTWYPHFRVIKLHNSNMKLGPPPPPMPSGTARCRCAHAPQVEQSRRVCRGQDGR